MSDEKKKLSTIELAKSKGLDKFKTEEDLVNAYLDLEKAYSSRKINKNDSEKDILEKTANFFQGSHDNEDVLGGTLGKYERKVVEKYKIPPKIAAGIVAQVAGDVSEGVRQQSRDAVTEILGDSAKRSKIEEVLLASGELDDFQKRYEGGFVTPREANLLARLGGAEIKQENGKKGLENNPPDNSQEDIELNEAKKELMGYVGNMAGPYFRKQHPDHAKAQERVAKLKQIVRQSEIK